MYIDWNLHQLQLLNMIKCYIYSVWSICILCNESMTVGIFYALMVCFNPVLVK